MLQLPNALFYKHDLTEGGDRAVTHSLLRWERLPNREWPMIFHGVIGQDEREGNSPSWFNTTELLVCKDYLVK